MTPEASLMEVAQFSHYTTYLPLLNMQFNQTSGVLAYLANLSLTGV